MHQKTPMKITMPWSIHQNKKNRRTTYGTPFTMQIAQTSIKNIVSFNCSEINKFYLEKSSHFFFASSIN